MADSGNLSHEVLKIAGWGCLGAVLLIGVILGLSAGLLAGWLG